MDKFSILHHSADFVVVDKPSGFFVHRPESAELQRFCRPEQIVLQNLRRQIKQKLFPVHRLDVATSGALVFALNSEAAHHFCSAIQTGKVRKRYQLICRGWVDDQGTIDVPLALDSTGDMVHSLTHYRCLKRFERPAPEGYRFPTLRYSFVEAEPVTGRFHQIRRHFNRISHPIIGDNDHGDSRQNRFFREVFGIQGLCLRAVQIDFPNREGATCSVAVMASKDWQTVSELIPFANG